MFSFKVFCVALVLFAILDAVWFKLIAGNFFTRELAPVLNLKNGTLVVQWVPAILVYVLLALGVTLFVVPISASVSGAALYGAALGLVIYGVYDFTNLALLAHWTWRVAALDVAWGAASGALVGAIAKYVLLRF